MQKIILTKGNGLDAANDQPAKTLTKRTADFIFAVACMTSIDVAFGLIWASLGAQVALLVWGVLQ